MKIYAREFAIEKHGNQKYGEYPYSVHLDAVAAIASEYGESAKVVAYLHDVVEDTDTTIEEIEREFGALVAGCVAILTDESGETRQERKEKTYQKMAAVTGDLELALIVKAADRLANFKACVSGNNQRLLEMYKKEQDVFKKSVYRAGLCDSIWDQIDAYQVISKKTSVAKDA